MHACVLCFLPGRCEPGGRLVANLACVHARRALLSAPLTPACLVRCPVRARRVNEYVRGMSGGGGKARSAREALSSFTVRGGGGDQLAGGRVALGRAVQVLA